MDVVAKTTAFFEKYPLRTFAKRELLLHADEAVSSVFYIIEGHVSQYDIAPNGNEIVVNMFKPGAFFPMSTAINGTTNHYFFEASTPTIVRVAPKDDAVRFLQDNPDILFELLARVYRGVDGVLRRMAHLMGGGAESRLIFELINTAYRFGEQKSDGSILVAFNEGDLAKHSGLARETVSRILQRLKTAGLIKVSQSGIMISSVQDLETRLGTSL